MSAGGRAEILARVREALRAPAPRRDDQHGAAARDGTTTAPFREWLPPVGASFGERLTLFIRQCEVLRAEFHECADRGTIAAHLGERAQAHGWRRLALHRGELIDSIAPLLPASVEPVRLEAGYDKLLLESCDAALTECETLIAQTGSACVTSRSSGGRALSVLPPHHLIVARRAQLVPDLPAAFEALAQRYGADLPSFISFISGPSRTGDIERILVLGAHGPKRLEILLLP